MSPLEKRLTDDEDALVLCQKFDALRLAQTAFDDISVKELYAMYLDGINAATLLTPRELGEIYDETVEKMESVDEFLKVARQELDA